VSRAVHPLHSILRPLANINVFILLTAFEGLFAAEECGPGTYRSTGEESGMSVSFSSWYPSLSLIRDYLTSSSSRFSVYLAPKVSLVFDGRNEWKYNTADFLNQCKFIS
jgi:hypothetical protein